MGEKPDSVDGPVREITRTVAHAHGADREVTRLEGYEVVCVAGRVVDVESTPGAPPIKVTRRNALSQLQVNVAVFGKVTGLPWALKASDVADPATEVSVATIPLEAVAVGPEVSVQHQHLVT